MSQPIQLGNSATDDAHRGMRRINRLPLLIGIVVVLLFIAIVVFGISWRGLTFNAGDEFDGVIGAPASSFGERLKQSVSDGIIGEDDKATSFQLMPKLAHVEEAEKITLNEPVEEVQKQPMAETEPEDEWRTRLNREQDERITREFHRQQMASLQAHATAVDSPLAVDISTLEKSVANPADLSQQRTGTRSGGVSDIYAAAMKSGLLGGNADPNGQVSKEGFLNRDIKELGYLPDRVVPQQSRYELKRGSVIPATLISGLSSDLPGRLVAQVSRNVYDSATGSHLLIAQGTKLFGRYDSKVSFGQERALVVWTDLVFPNGSTLQIGGMAGTDPEGYGGFEDKVDRHLLRTFGSAALVAIIGTGIDMLLPESSSFAFRDSSSDAVRRNFADSFGRVAEQSITKHLNVQPTIRIRPGYTFNVLVDQDLVFPGPYKD